METDSFANKELYEYFKIFPFYIFYFDRQFFLPYNPILLFFYICFLIYSQFFVCLFIRFTLFSLLFIFLLLLHFICIILFDSATFRLILNYFFDFLHHVEKLYFSPWELFSMIYLCIFERTGCIMICFLSKCEFTIHCLPSA